MSGPSTGTQPDSGIKLLSGDTCIIDNTNVTQHGIALWLTPASGIYLGSVNVGANCFFDNAGTNSGGSQNCVLFSGAGEVQNTKFTGVWFGLSHAQSGCAILPVTGGTVTGVSFTGCEFPGNGDSGIIFGNSSGGTVTGVNIVGGGSGGNTNNGVRITGACSYWSIVGHISGNYSGRGSNNYGIEIDSAASDYFKIDGCNLWNNTTSALSDNSTGTHGQITNNAGYNGASVAIGITVSASPFTYTAGHTPEMVYVDGGTVSSITMDGNVLINQTAASIYMPPNSAITVTYSSLPTLTKKKL
jgi:hypothetical protein